MYIYIYIYMYRYTYVYIYQHTYRCHGLKGKQLQAQWDVTGKVTPSTPEDIDRYIHIYRER